jgi:hypothetical protein
MSRPLAGLSLLFWKKFPGVATQRAPWPLTPRSPETEDQGRHAPNGLRAQRVKIDIAELRQNRRILALARRQIASARQRDGPGVLA